MGKFIKAGSKHRSPEGAVKYVLALHEANGQLRHARPEILAGSPEEFLAWCAQIGHLKHKYKSFVLSWADEDAPTHEEIIEECQRWESVAFSGLEKGTYSYLAVLHTSRMGGHDVHILSPSCVASPDIDGDGRIHFRSLNICPPSKSAIRAFVLSQEVANATRGWSSILDPNRARLVRPSTPAAAFADAALLRAGLQPGRRAEHQISDWLTRGVQAGKIRSRQDLVQALSTLGEVTRQGEEYVSVKLPGRERAMRLKGLLYERALSPARILERLELPGHAGVAEHSPLWRGSEPDAARAARAAAELAPLISAKARYHRARYGQPVVDQLDGNADRAPGEGAGRAQSTDRPGHGQDQDARHPSRPDDGTDGHGSSNAWASSSRVHRADRGASQGRLAASPSAPAQGPALGRGHADSGNGDDVCPHRRGHVELGPDADISRTRRTTGADPAKTKPASKRKAQQMTARSVIDQLLERAQARAANEFHHQHQPKELPMPTTPPVPPVSPQSNPTPAPAPTAAEAPRPSLRDSLRFDGVPMKKSATAAAAAGTSGSGRGVDADRPRPPALKTEASALAAPDAWPVDFLSKLIEAFRRVLQKIASFFVGGPTPTPAGTVQTLDADTDPRGDELRALREEVQHLKHTLARYRKVAEAAGVSLDNALAVQDVTESALGRAARALELDRQRDLLRNEKESKALPGDAQLDELAAANLKLAQAQHGRDDVMTLGQEAVAAANQAEAWATVKSVGAAGSIAHALVGEQLFLQKAIGEVLDEQEQQTISDREHAAQEQDIGPNQAPSVLDITDAKRAAELRATFLSASRRLRLLHAHQVHHVPPYEQEAFHALPLGEARLQFIKDHDEKIKQGKAALEEAIQDAALARNQAAAQLWPDGLDDEDADADQAARYEQERP